MAKKKELFGPGFARTRAPMSYDKNLYTDPETGVTLLRPDFQFGSLGNLGLDLGNDKTHPNGIRDIENERAKRQDQIRVNRDAFPDRMGGNWGQDKAQSLAAYRKPLENEPAEENTAAYLGKKNRNQFEQAYFHEGSPLERLSNLLLTFGKQDETTKGIRELMQGNARVARAKKLYQLGNDPDAVGYLTDTQRLMLSQELGGKAADTPKELQQFMQLTGHGGVSQQPSGTAGAATRHATDYVGQVMDTAAKVSTDAAITELQTRIDAGQIPYEVGAKVYDDILSGAETPGDWDIKKRKAELPGVVHDTGQKRTTLVRELADQLAQYTPEDLKRIKDSPNPYAYFPGYSKDIVDEAMRGVPSRVETARVKRVGEEEDITGKRVTTAASLQSMVNDINRLNLEYAKEAARGKQFDATQAMQQLKQHIDGYLDSARLDETTRENLRQHARAIETMAFKVWDANKQTGLPNDPKGLQEAYQQAINLRQQIIAGDPRLASTAQSKDTKDFLDALGKINFAPTQTSFTPPPRVRFPKGFDPKGKTPAEIQGALEQEPQAVPKTTPQVVVRLVDGSTFDVTDIPPKQRQAAINQRNNEIAARREQGARTGFISPFKAAIKSGVQRAISISGSYLPPGPIDIDRAIAAAEAAGMDKSLIALAGQPANRKKLTQRAVDSLIVAFLPAFMISQKSAHPEYDNGQLVAAFIAELPEILQRNIDAVQQGQQSGGSFYPASQPGKTFPTWMLPGGITGPGSKSALEYINKYRGGRPGPGLPKPRVYQPLGREE